MENLLESLPDETQSPPPRDVSWWSEANCRGHQSVFFPMSRRTMGEPEWERETETQAKKICANCVLKDTCFLYGLELIMPSSAHPTLPPGIYGGANQWERRWIEDNAEKAVALKSELDAKGVDPEDLRRFAERNPPRAAAKEAGSVALTSQQWGVAPSVARFWRQVFGGGSKKDTLTPWGDAMQQHLIEENDWVYRRDLITIGASVLNPSRVERKRKNMEIAKKGQCTTRAAQESMLDPIIRTCLQSKEYEQRKCPETGRVQLRINPLFREKSIQSRQNAMDAISLREAELTLWR